MNYNHNNDINKNTKFCKSNAKYKNILQYVTPIHDTDIFVFYISDFKDANSKRILILKQKQKVIFISIRIKNVSLLFCLATQLTLQTLHYFCMFLLSLRAKANLLRNKKWNKNYYYLCCPFFKWKVFLSYIYQTVKVD